MIEIGDVIAITTMTGFDTASLPIYAMRVSSKPPFDAMLLTGWYRVRGGTMPSAGKRPGETFTLGSTPTNPGVMNWCIVPEQMWPEEVTMAVAEYALTGKVTHDWS
jgi:hypothetical protein